MRSWFVDLFLLAAFRLVQAGQPVYSLRVTSDTNATSGKQDVSRKDTWSLSPGDQTDHNSRGLWQGDPTAWSM